MKEKRQNETVTFEICNPGFSPGYEHMGIQFEKGRASVSGGNVEILRRVKWCREDPPAQKPAPASEK